MCNSVFAVRSWISKAPILLAEPEANNSKTDPGRLSGKIQIDYVTFRYRNDGALTLDDVSIHAKPGEFIALVGPSGSGKSTLFRLLLVSGGGQGYNLIKVAHGSNTDDLLNYLQEVKTKH
ncbi:hypothetical protein CAL7716_004680 [Calothrix sp. PCC 7716]|nr:hypothetical protein CAL7716_004680 [Calothrix sp. PCC 7716]